MTKKKSEVPEVKESTKEDMMNLLNQIYTSLGNISLKLEEAEKIGNVRRAILAVQNFIKNTT